MLAMKDGSAEPYTFDAPPIVTISGAGVTLSVVVVVSVFDPSCESTAKL
jgi:hypothetical protein